MLGRTRWTVSYAWGRYEIELDPFLRVTPSEQQTTESEFQSMLFAFRRFDEDISSTILEIYVALTDSGRLFLNEQDFHLLRDPHWREQVSERLLRMAQSGWIHVRSLDAELRVLQTHTLPLPSLDKPPPKPSTPQEVPTTRFELQVLDAFGRALEGLPVIFSVGGSRQTVETDGEGIARLTGQQTSFASVRIEDVEAIQEKLDALGEAAPGAEVPPESADVSVHMFSLSSFPSISLEDKTKHTLVICEPVVRVRLLGMFFDEAKAFLLPSAMNGIQTLVEVYNENPKAKLLVVGHTDREGKEADNAELSLERAKAIAAYLRDDVDHWLSFYEENVAKKKRWGSLEDRYMLSSLPLGSPDPYLRPGQTLVKAIREFQTEHGLTRDGLAGPETRRALITDYMALDGTSVPEGTEIVTHGCGENFPAVVTDDGEEEPENRRVEIFVFPRNIQPEPPGEVSEEGSTEYPQWVEQVEETIDVSLDDTSLIFDYGYEEKDGHVLLSFSIKNNVQGELKVRLFECSNFLSPNTRKKLIRNKVKTLKEESGFVKTGIYYTLQGGETLETLKARYGFTDVREIFEHFENTELRMLVKNPSNLNPGDIIYIPQLRLREPIPLGELLAVEEVDEAVPGGQRFQAKWPIDANQYNMLDPQRWFPEAAFGIAPLKEKFIPIGNEEGELFFPHFAVLKDDFTMLGASPSPLALVQETKYEGPEGISRMHAFFLDGSSREVPAPEGSEVFAEADEPITFFGSEFV